MSYQQVVAWWKTASRRRAANGLLDLQIAAAATLVAAQAKHEPKLYRELHAHLDERSRA